MKLYSVTVEGVHPLQCVVVWDVKAKAQALADHLNATIRNVVTVREVAEFFPSDMTNADAAWLKATDDFISQRFED